VLKINIGGDLDPRNPLNAIQKADERRQKDQRENTKRLPGQAGVGVLDVRTSVTPCVCHPLEVKLVLFDPLGL